MEKRWASWSRMPIPNVSFSSSGLLALADLSTIAQRTALTGTSSWWDVLVLAPGIHHQQSADKLAQVRYGAEAQITNLGTGERRFVTNTATIHYFNRIGSKDKAVTLDVGLDNYSGKSRRGPSFGPRARIFEASDPTSKLSTLLYLLSLLLTLGVICIMVAMAEWWGLGEILALMAARACNIWIIQNRTTDPPPESEERNQHQSWLVSLDGHEKICLRGLSHDVEAITTGTWMREKSIIEGYLEATAKMIVYLVAVISENMTQAGDITLMVLLLASAGLLALSNAQSKTFNMNGRVATVTGSTQTDDPDAQTDSDKDSRSSLTPISDIEKSEGSIEFSRTYPFQNRVHYG